MAYIILSEPGTKYGPCKEPCAHKDCAATRKEAESICSLCSQPLGYQRKITRDNEYGEVHMMCLEGGLERGEGIGFDDSLYTSSLIGPG